MLNTDQSPASADRATKDGPLQWIRQYAQIADVARTLVVAVAGMAAAILGVWQDSSVSYAIALAASVLVVALIGYHVWRARHPLPLEACAADKSPRGLLRSSLPFARPPLPERADEAEGLFDMVTALDYRFGALVGRFGSGKTSLLRAELLPRLAGAGHPAVYVPSPGSDAMTVTREAILAQLSREASPPTAEEVAGADLSGLLRMLIRRSDSAVTLVYDQFDAFLLGRNQPQVHDAFVNWLRESVNDAALNVRFLFVVRDDLISRFLALEALVVEGQTGAHSYQLSDLTPEDALRVLRQTVEQRETGFEAGLIAELVKDLTDDGLVSPSLLQMVATRLKQREIKTLRQYQDEGEATGILQAYVTRQLADSRNPLVGRAVLHVLVREPAGRATESHTLEEIQEAVKALDAECGEDRDAQLPSILRQFTSARLVIRRCGDAYAVAYPLLRPSIVAALDELAGAENKQSQRARELLGTYVAQYRTDDRTRIRTRHLSQIRKYAPLAAQRQEPARSLIQKSAARTRLLYAGAAVLVAITIAIALVSLNGLLGPWQAWELATGITLQDPGVGHATTPSAVAFHPNGKQVVLANAGNSGGLFLLNFHSGNFAVANLIFGSQLTNIKDADGARFTALAFGTDELSMVSGQDDGTIRIWRTSTWTSKVLRQPERPRPESGCSDPSVVALRYDSDGTRLLAAIACGRIEVWDTRGPTLFASRPVASPIASSHVAFSSDGTRIAARQSRRGVDGVETIRVWTLEDRELREAYEQPIMVGADPILALGFDAANRVVVGTSDQHHFKLVYYDQLDGRQLDTRDVGTLQADRSARAVIGRDAQIVGISDGKHLMRFWDLNNDQYDELRTGELIDSFLSPTGSTLVIAKHPKSPMFTNERRLLHLTGTDAP